MDSHEGGPPAQACFTLISMGGHLIPSITIYSPGMHGTGKKESQSCVCCYWYIFTAEIVSDYRRFHENYVDVLPGETRCITVFIEDDSMLEETENLIATVFLISTQNRGEVLLQDISINIEDNDG